MEKRETLLLNWLYYRPVGHLLEALKLSKGFALKNPQLDIFIVINGDSPTELSHCCSWINGVYPIFIDEVRIHGSAAPSIRAIPTEWDYVVTDFRATEFLDGWDDARLIAAHAILKRIIKARKNTSYLNLRQPLDGNILPMVPNPRIELLLPGNANLPSKQEANRIVVLMGGSAGHNQSPTIQMWFRIFKAIRAAFPHLRIVITGVDFDKKDRTKTVGFTSEQVAFLARNIADVHVAYNIGIWKQLELIKSAKLFLSPHTGFAFLSFLVGTPWLEIAGCRWPAYLFNDVPFYSVLPDCGCYPSHLDNSKACHIRLSRNQRSLCSSDDALEKKLAEIIDGVRLLLQEDYTYDRAFSDHIQKITAHYDLRNFFFLGGLENLMLDIGTK